MAIPILVMFPFLVLSILTESGYPYFLRWLVFGQNSFFWYGFYYKIDKDQEMQYQKSYMIVANHTSMADIMLMLAITKSFCFVGKRSFQKFLYLGFLQKNLHLG
jgi:1-acyl-sn-glycerol-3-phosphate acyltransferase